MFNCPEPLLHRVYRERLSKFAFFRVMHTVLGWVHRNLQSFRFSAKPSVLAQDIYRIYLKRFAMFRWLKAMLLPAIRATARALRKLIKPLRTRQYMFLSATQYQDADCMRKRVIDEEVLEIKGPRFIGYVPDELECDGYVQFEYPPIEIRHYCRAAVIGGTNFIKQRDVVTYPNLFDPIRDVPPIESFGMGRVLKDGNAIELSISRASRSVYGAASLLGQCTGNYAHWLTETLPKLLILNERDEYNDIPILMDSWIHNVFYDSVALFGRKGNDVIRIKRWESVSMGCVVDVTPTAYVPPEYRIFKEHGLWPEARAKDFPFSRFSLNLLRQKALDLLDKKGVQESGTGDKKIYLRRTREASGNPRHCTNIGAVEKIVKKHGFEIVEPSRLSLVEQMALFHDAKIIVSPVGAALANLVFTKPGCQILALSPYYTNANYYYFSNLMGVLGHDLYYVLGDQITNHGHPAHRDYNVDLVSFKLAMKELCG